MKYGINRDFFLLHACCIPVKGVKRSIICDLQRNAFVFIQNELFEMFTNPINLTKLKHNEILELLNYLINKDFGFVTNHPEHFPTLDLINNDVPEIIMNAIIDFDKKSQHDLSDIVDQLSDFYCPAVQFRYYDTISLFVFTNHLKKTCDSTIRSLHVNIRYDSWITEKKLINLFSNYKRLSQIIVHSSPYDKAFSVDLNRAFVFSKEEINDASCCGNIVPHSFRSNIDFFKESHFFNNCLNKKIGIDVNGNIKNCPSSEKCYENINNVKLTTVINTPEFRKLWNINKDSIEICKICEFRYICPDCRIFRLNSDNLFSKPLKCSYDPYQNIWL